jgi:hypothetical protein
MSTVEHPNTSVGRSRDPEPDLFLSESRAAELLSVNARTLQNWRLKGTGPRFVRISSRCIRYRYRDLMLWAEAMLRSSTSET